MSLPPFLNKLRQRPGMYIGKPSLTRLAGFLWGYDTACHDLQATRADPFFISFQQWIEGRLQTGHVGWVEAILQQATSEEDAFDRFWELFDEYSAGTGNADTQANGPSATRRSAEKEYRP